ncbi:MAG: GPW/gp25 family protein [Bacilli bacterium]|nr:GPW/gp25 family protein [Bacilli bacterium]
MLDLDKNSDYLWLQTGHKQGEYYDLNSEIDQGELWNKLALDQMIEMVLVTEPQERLFNLAFGSPVYQILFENFTHLDTIVDTIFDVIEYWVPIKINRSTAKIEADPDNHALIFNIPYVSNNGDIVGVFGRKITK